VNGNQPTVWGIAGISNKRCDQCIAVHTVKPPLLTKVFVHSVRQIEHHHIVSSTIIGHCFSDKHAQLWSKQVAITLVEATEEDMVEVVPAFHCSRQQPISLLFSTCLLLWHGKEVQDS
jgi:hypothetical protein